MIIKPAEELYKLLRSILIVVSAGRRNTDGVADHLVPAASVGMIGIVCGSGYCHHKSRNRALRRKHGTSGYQPDRYGVSQSRTTIPMEGPWRPLAGTRDMF